jgi:transposase
MTLLLQGGDQVLPAQTPELLLSRSGRTVRFWIRRFKAHGPAGWYDDPRSGRPRTVDPQVLAAIVTMLQDAPRHEG